MTEDNSCRSTRNTLLVIPKNPNSKSALASRMSPKVSDIEKLLVLNEKDKEIERKFDRTEPKKLPELR